MYIYIYIYIEGRCENCLNDLNEEEEDVMRAFVECENEYLLSDCSEGLDSDEDYDSLNFKSMDSGYLKKDSEKLSYELSQDVAGKPKSRSKWMVDLKGKRIPNWAVNKDLLENVIYIQNKNCNSNAIFKPKPISNLALAEIFKGTTNEDGWNLNSPMAKLMYNQHRGSSADWKNDLSTYDQHKYLGIYEKHLLVHQPIHNPQGNSHIRDLSMLFRSSPSQKEENTATHNGNIYIYIYKYIDMTNINFQY